MTSATLRQITGVMKDPSGKPYASKNLLWVRETRAVTAKGQTTVVDEPFMEATGADGAVDIEVMSGNYIVQTALSDTKRAFRVVVPDADGPHDIAGLISLDPVDEGVLSQVEGLAASALAAQAAAEAAADRVDLGALDEAVTDAEAARDGAAVSLSGAQAAQAAAEDAAQYDYFVDDAAALSGLSPAQGERSFVRDTAHVWEYDGSSWQDLGGGPGAVSLGAARALSEVSWSVPVGGTTKFFCEYLGAGAVSVGWTAARLVAPGVAGAQKIPNRASASLSSGQCIYIDFSEAYPGDPGYTLTEAPYSATLSPLFFTGARVLLVANLDGNLFGALAARLAGAVRDTSLAGVAGQARLSRYAIGAPGVLSSAFLAVFPLSDLVGGVSVSWGDLTVLEGGSNSGRNIADLAPVDLAPGRALYFDSAEAYPGAAGFTVVEGDLSAVGNASVTGGIVLLLGNVNGRFCGLLADQAEAALDRAAAERLGVDSPDASTFYVYQKGGGPRSARYIRTTYARAVNAGINVDVWRVAQMEEVERVGPWAFDLVRTLISTEEEVEFAVREAGAPSGGANEGYHGGAAHGNQTTLDVNFFLDGAPVSPGAVGLRRWCDSFEVLQKSQVWYFDHAGGHEFDQAEKLAVLWSRWSFGARICGLDQTLEWERSIVTGTLFMSMLPFARGAGPDYVSSDVRFAPLFEPIDVTGTSGATAEFAPDESFISGDVGVSARRVVRQISGATNNPAEWLAMQASKNKLYLSPHRGAATVVGESIRVVVDFEVTTSD